MCTPWAAAAYRCADSRPTHTYSGAHSLPRLQRGHRSIPTLTYSHAHAPGPVSMCEACTRTHTPDSASEPEIPSPLPPRRRCRGRDPVGGTEGLGHLGGRGWGGTWRSVRCGVAWPFLLQPWSGAPSLHRGQPSLSRPLVVWLNLLAGGHWVATPGSVWGQDFVQFFLLPMWLPQALVPWGPGLRGKDNGSTKSQPWPPTPTLLMSPGEGQGPRGSERRGQRGPWRPASISGQWQWPRDTAGHLRSAPGWLCEAPHPARPNLSQVRCPPRVAAGAQGSSPRGVWRDAGRCEDRGAPGGPGKTDIGLTLAPCSPTWMPVSVLNLLFQGGIYNRKTKKLPALKNTFS